MKFKTFVNDQKLLLEFSKYNISHLISIRAIPLIPSMMERLGFVDDNADVYHLTNIKELSTLKQNQNTRNQISAFTKGGPELQRLPSQVNILVKLRGRSIIEGTSDIWSLVDTKGRRWLDQTHRVPGNKLSFNINGILQKLFRTFDIQFIDNEKEKDISNIKAPELKQRIDSLPQSKQVKFYREYLRAMENYLNRGYKDLVDYLEKASDLSYNEIIFSHFNILYVQSIDFTSEHITKEIENLGLVDRGVITIKEIIKIKKEK